MPRGLRVALTFVAGTLCFIGVPLAGWGIDDPAGFARERARLLYLGVVTGLNLFAAVVSPEVGKERAKATKVVAGQRLSLPLLQIFSLALVFAAPYCDRRGMAVVAAGAWLRHVGLALYVIGFLLAFWAQLALGRLFSVTVSIQEGHHLVTDGLYSRIRHPRYLGIVLFTTGIALVFRSYVGLALVLATTLVLLWRIRDEEALLASEFGDTWTSYARRSWRLLPLVYTLLLAVAGAGCAHPLRLLNPDDPFFARRAPDACHVRLHTTEGTIVLEMRREWSRHGVDRFYNLVRAGYYDNAAIFRIREGTWAQFGINGQPSIARAWRNRTIPDDPRVLSNVRGTVAFAFKDPNGRTTQVFINLKDNSATHDVEPFVPFARIVDGMHVAERLNAEYGERAGGGIRAGRQDPLFDGGNAYLKRVFPNLDYILKAEIVK